MTEKADPENDIPSFDALIGQPEKPVIPARIHATAAAPLNKPSGEMRVYGPNPAYKWFENLSYTNPVLASELLARVENLPVEEFRKEVYAAYSQHYYAENNN